MVRQSTVGATYFLSGILCTLLSGCQHEENATASSELPPSVEAASLPVHDKEDPVQSRVSYTNGFKNFDEAVKPFAFILTPAKWKWDEGKPKIINVCWENPEPRFDTEQQLVRTAIEATWQAHSQLRFEGWKKCVQDNYGIHIQIEDSGPHTKGLGKQLDQVKNGMVLNFTFQNWSQSCNKSKKMRDECIYSIAVHEFGHALAFAHEQNRFDTPGECAKRSQGTDGDKMLTSYDPESVMNYCNPVYNNKGILSAKDKIAIAMAYGANK